MPSDLDSLRIDKSLKGPTGPSPWASRWILGGVALFVLAGLAATFFKARPAPEVRTTRAVAASTAGPAAGEVILNATGYIVAHHKIQLASKVVGKVAWIGVEKGDRVRAGQEIVRLEDDEYRAQLAQAKGQLAALNARLDELRNGSRPEEVAAAKANLDQAKADLENARISIERTRSLVRDGVQARQVLDDAQARLDGAQARVNSLDRTFELVRIGPRQELLQQVRGQIEEAKGRQAFFETQLANTVIRAPITGTILERVVERGEFVTTGFVGDRGAKGYVVSMADLNDLQVELDINQNDFARLGAKQKGVITTDAYPDRKYDGIIDEISPEANRQKATVQVKVKVLKPDEFLRPEMNASVAFVADKTASAKTDEPAAPIVYVPAGAVREGAVYLIVEGKAKRRAVRTSGSSAQGLRVEAGLDGGEEIIANPPADLKDGMEVKVAK
jgi:HlyD family secretion protein